MYRVNTNPKLVGGVADIIAGSVTSGGIPIINTIKLQLKNDSHALAYPSEISKMCAFFRKLPLPRCPICSNADSTAEEMSVKPSQSAWRRESSPNLV